MKTIYLHGSFGERFGHEWKLNVRSPAEAIRAINVNTENRFMDHIYDQERLGVRFSIITLGKGELDAVRSFTSSEKFDSKMASSIFANELTSYCSTSKKEFHFVPVVEGEAFIAALPGIIAAGVASVSWTTVAFYALGAMAIGAIANMLFPSPEIDDKTRQTKSYLFDDRPNITKQGAPVPVGYGMLKIGSNTLSFTRVNKDKISGGETNDLIETFTEYTVTDILSEGPIAGLCDINGRIVENKNGVKGLIDGYTAFDLNTGLKSIFLNDIPVMEQGGSLNFILNEGAGAGTVTGVEDQPKCSLGYMDQIQNSKGGLATISEVETQGQAALVGPNPREGESLKNMTIQKAISSRMGAKLFAYPITSRGIGQLKLTFSPEAMYNNWTDVRQRRGFLGMGARTRVDKGTSATTIRVGAAIKYAQGFVPLIEPKSGFSGHEGGTNWVTGSAETRRSKPSRVVHNALGKRNRIADPYPWEGSKKTDIVHLLIEAIFEDNLTIFSHNRNNGIQNFCEKFREAINSDGLTPPIEVSGSVHGYFQSDGGSVILPRTFKKFIQEYCEGYRLAGGGSTVYGLHSSPKVNKTAALLINLYSQARSGASAEVLSYNNYDDIMSSLKSASTPSFGVHRTVLGADGYFYKAKKHESYIDIKGISTSPAGLNLQMGLPYFGPSENLILNLARLTKEIVDPEEMTTTSNKMNLSGISSIATLMGDPIKYQHPGAAMIKIPFDAVNFPQLPQRNYLVKMKKVPVPSNYNPAAKKYHGAWNGLFKGAEREDKLYSEIKEVDMEWTDNPAWILIDILLNQRFGVGTFGFTIDEIDVWTLYAAAKFCDELVETGFPIEHPKRAFSSSSLKTRSVREFLDPHNTFIITITEGSYMESEFNMGSNSKVNGTQTVGKKIAFFMSDGSLEEREIVSVDTVSAQIKLLGPSFADHPSATFVSGSYVVGGECVLSDNYPIVEPRFSANVLFTQREEALRVVKEMCTIFRSVLVYSAGKVSVTTEKKKDPAMMFTDANIGSDGFSYAGAPKNSRITAAKVRYADKYDNFRGKVEYYEDASGIDKFGYNLSEVLGVGCTSRGQAKRVAKFMVLAPSLENEYITFETGIEAALLAPGSIIEVSDSRRYGENVNGRLKSVHGDAGSGGYVVVDKILNNLLFYDPANPGSTNSRVELAVVCGKGFETPASILDGSSSVNPEGQLAMISGISRPQMAYFDGLIGEDKRSIVSLKSKHRFKALMSSNLISAENHKLSNGDKVGFTSFGTLPSPVEHGKEYKVHNQTENTFQLQEFDGSGWADVTFTDIGYSDRGNPSDLDFVPSTPGGEHFYYAYANGDTDASLAQIGAGAVWSIRGYHRDVLGSMQQISSADLAEINTYLGGVPIGDSGYSYSERIGRYKVTTPLYRANDNDKTAAVLQLSARGRGLGGFSFIIPSNPTNLDRVTTHYKTTIDSGFGGWINSDRFGFLFELYKNNFKIPATGVNLDPLEQRFITRINQDSDIFVLHGASTETLSIGDNKFVVKTHGGQQFIRVSGGEVSLSEVSGEDAISAPGDLDSSEGTAAVSSILSDIALDINSFKNVGRIQYRVMSISEADTGQYRVRASEYNKDKFDIIEKELNIQKPLFPIPPQTSMNIPKAPSNLVITDLTNPTVT